MTLPRSRAVAFFAAGLLVLPLAGCGQAIGATYVPPEEPAVAGSFAGSGSSAMSKAMEVWTEAYMADNPDVEVTYDSIGSGGGREEFLAGKVAFGGSDAALSEEELEASAEVCAGGNGIDLPVYVSPISVAFNLEGIDRLNLRPGVIARIFTGEITRWNDGAITADNPDLSLPDLAITPVHREDDSGTTHNFTDYLFKVVPGEWPHEADGVWPLDGGVAAPQNEGVTEFVRQNVGAVTYADASRTGDLGNAALLVGNEFVAFTPEAAAAAIDVSPLIEGRTKHDLAYDIDRKTTESFAYPMVLVAYVMVCSRYTDESTGRFVKSFLTYIASPEGQQRAADEAGSAPVSDFVQRSVEEAAESIYLG
ncbi:phosphate ABC transporter substrate-binding protein PstS [Myceligenerans xiligouense]|uniref:Phosphate-binding protein n=1 Tax=Myceligenerans xiligouense TaxID=253184 RepID=A0A3N4ZG43_9MICO|nr:phosphate ABC transporter substrate-binding protein PstS [Myceligenerans xiligouense]RPF19795.1 phosphate ABC transporter substrate-binding protein (PhoT family) [Myceligenerans xiligouense]